MSTEMPQSFIRNLGKLQLTLAAVASYLQNRHFIGVEKAAENLLDSLDSIWENHMQMARIADDCKSVYNRITYPNG